MKNLKFIQIEKENDRHYQQLLDLWLPYMKEIASHKTVPDNKSYEELAEGAKLRANVQGTREDMHFELCYYGDELIGFGFYAVDLGGIKGVIDPGYGYIMEFYITPQNRRKGYGRIMFEHIEAVFAGHNSKYMYLTPDSKSGVPFWQSLGFAESDKFDPDNKMPIYTKEVHKI